MFAAQNGDSRGIVDSGWPLLVKMGKGLAAMTIGRDSGRPLIE